MDELAKKLINDHRNPIVKVDLPGTKLFLKSSTVEEVQFIEKHQNNLENLLSHERAERRCSRSQATWFSDINLAKVTKVVKTLLNHFGYQDKEGIFLYPEETLFLMESNRLEVIRNTVPLSILEGYELLSQCNDCSLTKYRVYKKLVLLGYKLLRYSEVLRRQSKNKRKNGEGTTDSAIECNKVKPTEKRSNEDYEYTKNSKKLCTEMGIGNCKQELVIMDANIVGSGSQDKKKDLQLEYIENLFKNLRDKAPREYNSHTINDEVPDYCVFLPHNKSRCSFDFNLFICENSIMQRNPHPKSEPSIFAICSGDNISFYRCAGVSLPFL